MLLDEHRFAYVSKGIAVLFNLDYEQMRFISTQRGGDIRVALKGIHEILDNCEK